MTYSIPTIDSFIKKTLSLFSNLIDKYHYTLADTQKLSDNYGKIIYKNTKTNRIIEIENSTGYTNYGYTIRICNLSDKRQYLIWYNLPWEKQDKECNFLIDSHIIFSDPEFIAIIHGEKWTNPANPFY